MSVVLTLGLVLLVGLWALAIYNRLVRLRQRVKSQWRQIEVQLKHHHDLVGELISAVGPRLSPDTAPSDVMAARDRAISARGPADAGVKETLLAKSLTRFRAVLEQDARLTADRDVHSLLEQLSASATTLNELSQSFNAAATAYNAAAAVKPNHVIAGFGSFRPAQRFELN